MNQFSLEYLPFLINSSFVFADQCVVVALTQSEVDISASLDERAGFFTHYVLNVSWCPTTCMYIHTCTWSFSSEPIACVSNSSFLYPIGTEKVLHYVVTRNPGGEDCGRTVSVTADVVSCTGMLCLHQ